MSRKLNRQPLLVRLDYENFILLKTKLTPPGHVEPPYGVMSDFFNRLLADHFAKAEPHDHGNT